MDIEVWDWDFFGLNQMIGKTTIDLEDRWFSEKWQAYGTEFEGGGRFRLKVRAGGQILKQKAPHSKRSAASGLQSSGL